MKKDDVIIKAEVLSSEDEAITVMGSTTDNFAKFGHVAFEI